MLLVDGIVSGAVRGYPLMSTLLKTCAKNAPDCSFNEI